MDRNDEIHFYKELDFWKVPLKHGAKAPPKSKPKETTYLSQQTSPGIGQHNSHNTFTVHRESRHERESAHVQRKTVAQNHTSASMSLAAPPKMPAHLPAQLLHDEYEASADGNAEDSQGVALKAAKDKWNELGPLRLEDIVQNSQEPIDQSMKFGQSSYNKYIIGQLASNGKVTGVGKEINHIIYEGQFIDDIYNGYGRFIYSNGNYYIG